MLQYVVAKSVGNCWRYYRRDAPLIDADHMWELYKDRGHRMGLADACHILRQAMMVMIENEALVHVTIVAVNDA